MDSPWGSLCLGKIPLLDKTERDNRVLSRKIHFFYLQRGNQEDLEWWLASEKHRHQQDLRRQKSLTF